MHYNEYFYLPEYVNKKAILCFALEIPLPFLKISDDTVPIAKIRGTIMRKQCAMVSFLSTYI